MNADLRLWQHGGDVALMGLRLRREADALAMREPLLARMCRSVVVEQGNRADDAGVCVLADVLARVLTRRLAGPDIAGSAFEELFRHVHSVAQALPEAAALDIDAVLRRDPATESALSVVLYQKGFQAIQLHRVAHVLWEEGRCDLALYLQSMGSRVLGVDIHPACRIGHGVMFDHATGIVIGETCVIGNGVSIMQGVTLGGTGKMKGDRHPKIGAGVLIGAGAVLLGNIVVGADAKVGAGSVVLADVAAQTTVAGVPAQPVGRASLQPAEEMDQSLSAGSPQDIALRHGKRSNKKSR
jgi:serine O-acetyltransferase